MRRFKCTALALVLGLVGCGGGAGNMDSTPTPDQTDAKRLAITAIADHPSLDSMRLGALESLAQAGFVEGQNLSVTYQNAQGNTANAGQIARQFVGENPDVIMAISTPSAQAVAASTQSIPLVFGAITDPVSAKLQGAHASNVTGTSDALPIEPQIDLIQEIVPGVQNIGFVYSSGESNSTIVLERLETALNARGLNLISAPSANTTGVKAAAESLIGRVDVIYTTTDNNVVLAYDVMTQVANTAKIPLIASNPEAVERGAVAALGVNYHLLGKETGTLIARVLQGENPSTIPVYQARELELHANPTNAAAQGIHLPQSVLDRAIIAP